MTRLTKSYQRHSSHNGNDEQRPYSHSAALIHGILLQIYKADTSQLRAICCLRTRFHSPHNRMFCRSFTMIAALGNAGDI